MPIVDHVISLGTPPQLANSICGGVSTLIAAGSTQATATLIPGGAANVSIVSTSGKAVQLPNCGINSSVEVWNGGASVLGVYGQTGEAIGSGAVNAIFYIGTKKMGIFKKVSATQWAQTLSA